MATYPVSSTPPANTSTPSAKKPTSKLQLQTEDFIKMMVTQLQQQDPMEPAKNEQLLAQMSQIGQLQSSTQLQESLKGLMSQNQISTASALIGKTVQGLDPNDDPIQGMVNSVRVADGNVTLELDNGQKLELGRVTSVSPGAAAGAAATTTPGA